MSLHLHVRVTERTRDQVEERTSVVPGGGHTMRSLLGAELLTRVDPLGPTVPVDIGGGGADWSQVTETGSRDTLLSLCVKGCDVSDTSVHTRKIERRGL